MRGNGLTADDYGVVADVSRTVGDDALLALRELGVAAYVVLPETADDDHARVFADRSALEAAREVVRRLEVDTPQHRSSGVLREEDAWAQIVAGYERSASEPGRMQPERMRWEPKPPRDPENHFEPPPAPPVPSTDLVGRLAWGGLLGGPALLLLVTVLGWQLPGMVTLLLVSGFVGGLVTLILRMNDRPPNDWGGDDGAVV